MKSPDKVLIKTNGQTIETKYQVEKNDLLVGIENAIAYQSIEVDVIGKNLEIETISVINAEIGLLFYFTTTVIAFYSRKIFLDNLGAEFIGLTGTLFSILSLLNISEVGISTCIGYFLYKPIEQGNKDKICEIVSLFGWLYRIVGSFILCGGILVSLFFPIMFVHV